MMQRLECSNKVDEDNNPTGGSVEGIGIEINWQDGPVGNGTKHNTANGAFVEGVIQAALQRIQFFENSKFACEENEIAADQSNNSNPHLK